MAEQSVRDRIRSKALGQDRLQSKLVEWDGEKLVVKQPNGKAFEAASKIESPFRKNMQILISCVFEADANGAPVRPLFESGDVERLMEMGPTDPFLTVLNDAIKSLTDLKTLQEDARKSAG